MPSTNSRAMSAMQSEKAEARRNQGELGYGMMQGGSVAGGWWWGVAGSQGMASDFLDWKNLLSFYLLVTSVSSRITLGTCRGLIGSSQEAVTHGIQNAFSRVCAEKVVSKWLCHIIALSCCLVQPPL